MHLTWYESMHSMPSMKAIVYKGIPYLHSPQYFNGSSNLGFFQIVTWIVTRDTHGETEFTL